MVKQFLRHIFLLVALFAATANLSAQTYNGGTWYSLYDANEYSISVFGSKTFNVFTPTLGNLTFEAKRQTAGQGNLQLIPIVNGADQSAIFSNKLNTSYTSYSLTLSNENTTQLKFYAPTGVTLKKYFKNIKLPLKKHILLYDDTDSKGMDYGTSSIGTASTPRPMANLATAEGKTSSNYYTIKFRSFLASGDITITSSNPEFHFGNGQKSITLGVANNYCASANGSGNCSATTLGQISNYNKQIYFSPAVQHDKNTRSTTITISDGTSTAYIYLSAPVIPTYFFKAEAISSPAEGGTATATFPNGQDNCSVIATNYTTTSMSATVIFTAAPNTANGYVFEGWKTDPASSTFYKQGADKTTFTETITSSALNPNGLASQKTYYAIYSRRYTAKITGSNYTGKLVDDSWKADYQFINTQTEKPTNSDADPFYFKIEHNFTGNDTREGSPRPNEVIAYDPATNTITALNEGVATITFYQKNTDSHELVSESFTVQVVKYTPTFTWNTSNTPYYFGTSIPNIFSTTNPDCQYTIVSDNEHVAKVIDNTLHIYNVEETANITVSQEENYKWYGKTKTYTITPENPTNHVTFTYTQAMFNDGTITTQKVSKYGVEWTSDNQLRLGGSSKTVLPNNPAYDWDDKYIVIHFEGIPKDISFKYKANTSDVSNGATALNRADWYIAEGSEEPNGEIKWSNNYPWKNLGGDNSNSKDWVKVSNQPLQSTTRYLKLCYSGNFAGYYSDIVVTELEKFEAGPKPLDFGTQSVNYGQQEKQVVFEHANIGRETTVTIEGADKDYFSVSPTTISNTGRDLYGTTYLDVTFDNGTTVRGDQPYTATLVIEDNAGHREEVQLTGVRYGKATPVFTWNPNNFPYYFNTSIANIVVSSNTDYANCPLEITSSNENIAKVDTNGRLYIYDQSGEVTFTVIQRGNNNYYDHTETFTFTPKAKPDLEVPFQVTQTIYGQAITVGDNCSWDGDDHHLKLGDGAFDDTKKTAILVFSGRPDKLTFNYATSNNVAVVEIGQTGNPQWEVEESSDGENWKSIWSVRTNSTSWADAEIPLSYTTQYVRFSYDGNFAGYFKNINISELVGYKYLRAADGHYLSRGGKWGTQAVVDAFGVVSRISRYTEDNENIYTRFFFVDNEQYMFETETNDDQRLHEVFTDDETALNTNHLWQINNNGGILTIQSANEVGVVSHKGNYITAINGVLAFTTNEAEATKWQMEDYTEHPQYITDMLNRQAAAAALKDFGEDINTLEKVRNRLKVEEFETREVAIQPLALGEQTGVDRTIEGMPHLYEQIITDVDTGFYRLTVKALYRISNSEIAWKCNQEKGKESVLAYAYANDVQYPIQSVYASYHSSAIENTDELRDGKYYSTTLSSANIAFNDANRYLNDVYVYVTPDPGKTTGTLRYGIKCPSYVPGAWLAYSTITLTHFARKEYIFEGDDNEAPTDWNIQANWNRGDVPNQYHNVKIQANVNIDSHIEVYGVAIDNNAKIHISSTGGLSVGEQGIQGAATNGSSIIIDNLKTGAGFLRISPDCHKTMPHFTMRYETASTLDKGANELAVWQYIGAPGANCQFTVDGITWLYHWSEKEGWINKTGTLTLEPFAGYAITQYGKPTYELVSTVINENKTITLTKTDIGNGMDGDNLFANSYSAPLDAKNFTPEDFSGEIVKTFYLFNSGSWNDWNNNQDSTLGNNNSDTPGQYRAIPALAASYIDANYDHTTIPPMQGVYVIAKENNAKIHLNYNKHVWKAGSAAGTNMHEPMRAPIHNVFKPDNFRRLRIQVNSANSGADRMYVIQDTITTTDYDNGYDAPNQLAEGLANIYTNEHFGQMEVSCSNHIDSTFVGFTAGSDSIYTLRFNAIIGDDLHLLDLDNDSIILLEEDATYTFHATPHSKNDLRFQILLHPEKNLDFGEEEKDEIYTDLTDVHTIQVWSHGSCIYINNVPANTIATLYNISGHKLLTTPIHHTPYTLDLSYLPKGVYMLQLNTNVYKFVIQ